MSRSHSALRSPVLLYGAASSGGARPGARRGL